MLCLLTFLLDNSSGSIGKYEFTDFLCLTQKKVGLRIEEGENCCQELTVLHGYQKDTDELRIHNILISSWVRSFRLFVAFGRREFNYSI